MIHSKSYESIFLPAFLSCLYQFLTGNKSANLNAVSHIQEIGPDAHSVYAI